jgi:hypothetical protein
MLHDPSYKGKKSKSCDFFRFFAIKLALQDEESKCFKNPEIVLSEECFLHDVLFYENISSCLDNNNEWLSEVIPDTCSSFDARKNDGNFLETINVSEWPSTEEFCWKTHFEKIYNRANSKCQPLALGCLKEEIERAASGQQDEICY